MNDDKDKLINDNIKLAYKIAYKYYTRLNNMVELEDLQSLSFIGLTKAAQSFDTNKNFAFSTYAYTVIKNEILQYIKQNIKHHNDISLSLILTGTNSDNHTLTLEDTLQSNINLEEDVQNNIEINTLYKYINELDDRKRTIILCYIQGLTFDKISSILNLSKSYINEEYRKAINILRYKYLKEGYFEE
jgi:RNA polymerase sporulation-specific sigma factor